jgi:hypothetical protein
MLLIENFTTADLSDPQPGQVFAGRIEADLLGAPFRLGRLAVLRVVAPPDPIVIGCLYILNDGDDVAIVRIQGASPDLWVVDEFSGSAPCQRRALSRRRWQPRAFIVVA